MGPEAGAGGPRGGVVAAGVVRGEVVGVGRGGDVRGVAQAWLGWELAAGVQERHRTAWLACCAKPSRVLCQADTRSCGCRAWHCVTKLQLTLIQRTLLKKRNAVVGFDAVMTVPGSNRPAGSNRVHTGMYAWIYSFGPLPEPRPVRVSCPQHVGTS